MGYSQNNLEMKRTVKLETVEGVSIVLTLGTLPRGLLLDIEFFNESKGLCGQVADYLKPTEHNRQALYALAWAAQKTADKMLEDIED